MALNTTCLRVLFLLLVTALAVESHGQRLHKTSWGGIVDMSAPEIADQDIIEAMLADVANNIQALEASGKLIKTDARIPTDLMWPLRPAADFDQYGFYGISFYVDLNPDYPGKLKDYACGDRTYDTFNGVNHTGTDIFPWPFWWNVMEAEMIEVVAAAPGQIVGKQDGHYDRICNWDTGAIPNAIFIRHDDGSETRYLHLKKNSLTDKEIGDYVEAGEYLGLIGSSGQSTGPHLHFEVADANGDIIDPFAGQCNQNGTMWEFQPPYFNSQVNHLSTQDQKVRFNSLDPNKCSELDEVNEQDEFCFGEKVYFYGFFRDLLQGSNQGAIHQIRMPDDRTYRSWSTSLDDDYTHASFAYTLDSITIPDDAMKGIWEYRIFYQGKIYTHHFGVCHSLSSGQDLLPESDIQLFPNPATNDLYISWPKDIDCCQAVQLRDLTGRIVSNQQITRGMSIDVATLHSGMYLMTLIGEENQIIGSKRFIKH